MKIKIEQGVTAKEAIKYLETFLKEHYEDYEILKGNMNIYLSLRDDMNAECPDNEKEFVLNRWGVTDVQEETFKKAVKWLQNYVDEAVDDYNKTYDVLSNIEENIQNAIGNNENENIINKMRCTQQEYLKHLEECTELCDKLEIMCDMIMNGSPGFFHIIRKESTANSKVKTEYYRVYFVCKNENGLCECFTWANGEGKRIPYNLVPM